ncbi:hypothetical protein GCM10027456_11220 [Kineosporia babensis]
MWDWGHLPCPKGLGECGWAGVVIGTGAVVIADPPDPQRFLRHWQWDFNLGADPTRWERGA